MNEKLPILWYFKVFFQKNTEGSFSSRKFIKYLVLVISNFKFQISSISGFCLYLLYYLKLDNLDYLIVEH
jgi:hypothetical protein